MIQSVLKLRFTSLLILLANLFFHPCLQSQNLIPNPGFEEYLDNPPYGAAGVNESVAWFGLRTTTDFFHRQYQFDSSLPQNFRGYQEPASGDGCAGIIAGPEANEYLIVELPRPLVAGALYEVGFKANLSNACRYGTDDLGLSFLYEDPFELDLRKDVVYHVKNPEGELITDTVGWKDLEGFYLAEGGEKYLMIGNFYSGSEMDLQVVNEGAVFDWAYFYIDDVFLYPCSYAPFEELSRDTVLCDGQSIRLSGLPGAKSHYWVGIDARSTIEVNEPGVYIVNNYDDCDNLLQLTYSVAPTDCDCTIRIPSVQYTGDPLQVLSDLNVQSFELEFYDASGRLVAATSNVNLESFQLLNYSALYFWKARLSCLEKNNFSIQKVMGGKVVVQH